MSIMNIAKELEEGRALKTEVANRIAAQNEAKAYQAGRTREINNMFDATIAHNYNRPTPTLGEQVGSWVNTNLNSDNPKYSNEAILDAINRRLFGGK